MCRLRNIALESVTDGQTDRQTDRQTDGQTDRQTDRRRRTNDPYVPLCFAGDTTKTGVNTLTVYVRPRPNNPYWKNLVSYQETLCHFLPDNSSLAARYLFSSGGRQKIFLTAAR